MNPSLEYLEHCSAETGYQVAPLEKVIRLGEIAADIARHPVLEAALALKGGTALNLCFSPPKRLSVDLDYNYVGHLEREKMLEDRPRVEQAVIDLAGRRGYDVQRSAEAFAGRKLFLRYRSVLGQNDRVEVDLNYLFRLPLAGNEMRFLWQPGGLDRPQVRTVSMEELLGGKLLALLDRGAARDFWDTAHLPPPAAAVLESPFFRAMLIALSATLEHPLPSYGRDRLAALLTDRDVSELLVPLLASSKTPHSADLFPRAWAVVEPFLSLNTNEKAYIAGIHRGEVRTDLLFPDNGSLALRIASHPAIQWKLANVRAYRARKGRNQEGAVHRDSPEEGTPWR